jgi:hypothetical protein
MLTYDLDETITAMMQHPETRLSAEACNAVNFCRSGHPCAKGKSEIERVETVTMAIVGRDVHPTFRERLDRLARQARKEMEAA